MTRVRSAADDVLLFSSGHFLRMLAARWTGIATVNASSLMLATASLSVLGYENGLSQPAIRLWNDTHHLVVANEMESSCELRHFEAGEVTR